MISDFRRAAGRRLVRIARSVGYVKPQNVRLGKGDGSGRIVSNLAERMVFFFVGTLGGDIISQGEAFLPPGVGMMPIDSKNDEGTPMQIRYGPGEETPQVFKILKEGFIGNSGRSPEEQYRDRAAIPSLAQLDTLRLRVVGNSNVVMVKGIYYYDIPTTGEQRLVRDPVIDLDADISDLESGEQQLALVYFDTITGTLNRALSSVVSTSDPLPKYQTFQDYSIANLTLPPYAIRLLGVYLYFNQALVDDDIYREYDARPLFQPTMQRWGTLTTTDATETLLIAVPVAEASAITISGSVVGVKGDDFSAAIGGTFTATARRATGDDVELVGTPTITTAEDSGGTPAISIDKDVGLQALCLYVQGIAGQDWRWRGAVTEIKVL